MRAAMAALVISGMAACSSSDKNAQVNVSGDSIATAQAPKEEAWDKVKADSAINTAVIGNYADGVCEVTDQQAMIKVLGTVPKYPVFIDFGATWCGPCKQFKPVFEDVADRYADKAQFFSVDVDACPELAKQCKIEGVPTLIVLYTDGSQATYVGTGDLLPAEKFETIVSKAL